MLDLHTHLWRHAPGTPTPTLEQLAAYCDRAHELGIAQIAITEHSHRFDRIIDEVFPRWKRPLSGPVAEATAHVVDVERGADLDAYVELLCSARDAGLPVLVGIEADYLPGAVDAMRSVIADYPFDVVVGSVHWLDEWLFDAYDNPVFGARWHERDTDEVFVQYVDHVLDLARSGLADVLAHIDVIKVAGYLPARLDEHEDRLVRGLADADVVIEMSSAGLRKPVAATYPSASLLDRLVEAGCMFTTASDAHAVDQIGAGFDALRQALHRCRVTELVTFDRRQRVAYPLGD